MLSNLTFMLVFYISYSSLDRKYLKDYYLKDYQHYRLDTTHYTILKMI